MQASISCLVPGKTRHQARFGIVRRIYPDTGAINSDRDERTPDVIRFPAADSAKDERKTPKLQRHCDVPAPPKSRIPPLPAQFNH
jgi:hypothetical protein